MIYSLIIQSIAASAFAFEGGNDFALCVKVAEASKAPVAILAEPNRVWKRTHFEYRSKADLASRLQKSLGLRRGESGGVLCSAWPLGTGYTWYWEGYRTRFEPPKGLERRVDGLLSISTAGKEALSLSDLSRLGLSKTVTWERFFDRVRLRMFANAAKESDILECIAEAIGARIEEQGTTIKFVIDPKEYKRRSVAMWNSVLKNPENSFEAANARYAIALLPLCSERLISRAFADPERPGGWGQEWPVGSLIHQLAWQRPAPYFLKAKGDFVELFRKIANTEAPVYGYIEDTGVPRAGYLSADRKQVVIL
jgi:hypothetical protein